MKQIMVNFNFKGATSEQYDGIMDDLNPSGILNNSGLMFHACATSPNGLKVCDVWESEALSHLSVTVLDDTVCWRLVGDVGTVFFEYIPIFL